MNSHTSCLGNAEREAQRRESHSPQPHHWNDLPTAKFCPHYLAPKAMVAPTALLPLCLIPLFLDSLPDPPHYGSKMSMNYSGVPKDTVLFHTSMSLLKLYPLAGRFPCLSSTWIEHPFSMGYNEGFLDLWDWMLNCEGSGHSIQHPACCRVSAQKDSHLSEYCPSLKEAPHSPHILGKDFLWAQGALQVGTKWEEAAESPV